MDASTNGNGDMDDDLQLQLALALSLAEVQPNDHSSGQAELDFASSRLRTQGLIAQNTQLAQDNSASAGNAPFSLSESQRLQSITQTSLEPMTGASVNSQMSATVAPTAALTSLATALQQAMQAALAINSMPQQAAAAAGNMAPPPAAAAAPTVHPAAPSLPTATRIAPSSLPRLNAMTPASTPQPEWIKPLLTWWVKPGQPSGGNGKNPQTQQVVPLPANEVEAGMKVLSSAFGEQVVVAGIPGMPQGLLQMRCTVSNGSLSVSLKDSDVLVSAWLARGKFSSKMRSVHDAHASLMQLTVSSTLPASGKDLAHLVSTSLAKMAFETLRDDEDDLYYEKGQATSQLINELKLGHIRAPFLELMCMTCHSAPDVVTWTKLLRAVLGEPATLSQIGTSMSELEQQLRAMDTFTSPSILQQCLLAALAGEVQSCSSATGSGRSVMAKNLESSSVLGSLLGVSSLVNPLSVLRGPPSAATLQSRGKDAVLSLRGYPAVSPGDAEVVQKVLGSTVKRVQEAGHLLLERLIKGKDKGASSRELVVSWLAILLDLNLERTSLGEAGKFNHLSGAAMIAGSSDGFMVNLVGILLRFCRPFVVGYIEGGAAGKFGDLMEKHLDASHLHEHSYRLGGMPSGMTSLAGERGASSTSLGARSNGLGASSNGCYLRQQLGPTPTFVADVFFLTQKAVWVGLMPALHRYQVMSDLANNYHKQQQQNGQGSEDAPSPHRRGAMPPLLAALMWDLTRAQILEPSFSEDMVQFSILTLTWLHNLLRTGKVDAFKLVPEYMLSNCLSWLEFVIRGGQAVVVASKPVSLIMSSIVALLEAPTLVRSPLLHDKMVKLLLTMLGPQLDVARRTAGSGLGRTVMMPGEAALVSAVLRTAAGNEALLPALMRTYVAADYVVGLDVDKDNFDKFSMRSCIDMILEELWKDEHCQRSIVSLAAGAASSSHEGTGNGNEASAAAFREYITCVLNSLMYLFKDSLQRLLDIHEIEKSRADATAWSALPSDERQQKDSFYQAQQHTTRGFMRMAVSTLHWLNILAENTTVVTAFLHPETVGRAAYACIHFLELLAGPNCQNLTVDRPEQYTFDRPALMESTLSLMLRLARWPAFVSTLVMEPDLDLMLLDKVHNILEENHQAMLAQSLQKTVSALEAAGDARRRQVAAATAATASSSVTGLDRTNMDDSDEPTKKLMRPNRGSDISDGATSASEGEGVAELACLALPELAGSQPGSAEMEIEYMQQLEGLSVGEYDSMQPRGYHRQFAEKAQEAAGESPQKVKRLNKEVKDLHSKTRLPCHASAAIFLRYDANRMDKMRVMMTGPEGTPYEGGCFTFDLYFPEGYPNVPPLMVLQTTGQGRVRFNPNLYADGKVCLSLLGTWHGGHESEKWNPMTSTVFQIVMSIQSQILVEDPYFNEPSHDGMRGTAEGRAHSALNNAELQLNNLRWAMIDVLRTPPPGFEAVVTAHFRTVRRRIMNTARRWLEQSAVAGEIMQRRMDTAVCELHCLLAAL